LREPKREHKLATVVALRTSGNKRRVPFTTVNVAAARGTLVVVRADSTITHQTCIAVEACNTDSSVSVLASLFKLTGIVVGVVSEEHVCSNRIIPWFPIAKIDFRERVSVRLVAPRNRKHLRKDFYACNAA
jgi:hypothetical protein